MKEVKKIKTHKNTFDIALIENPERQPLSSELKSKILTVYQMTGIPPFGLTILGGRVYVNVSGLDHQIQQAERDGKFKVKGIYQIQLSEPTAENEYLTGYRAVIELEDDPKRMELRTQIISEALKVNKTEKEIDKILEVSGLLPPRFVDEGWATPTTCQAIAYSYKFDPASGKKIKDKILLENLLMMAIRKATNRAKRQLIGCGITSIEELPYVTDKVNLKENPVKHTPEAKVQKIFEEAEVVND